MGLILAAESEPFRSNMIGLMHQFAGADPQHDAEIIGRVRACNPTIRKYLDSEAIAREFARRVGQRALLVLAETTQKNRN